MILNIVLTIFLVLLNGFFVAAEFSIVKVRSSQIDLKVRLGSKSAALAKKITRNLDNYLAATQLGITIASLLLGYFGEKVFSAGFISLFAMLGFKLTEVVAMGFAFPLAFIFITALHIIFGELAPKSIAIQNPASTSISISVPLHVFYLVFRPLIWILNGLANSILSIFNIKPVSGYDIHSSEELQLILEQGKASGALDSSEHELIQNVFDFKDRIVKNIMVPRTQIAAIDVKTPEKELLSTVISEGYSRIPVYEESIDNIIGVVHAKDILPILADKRELVLKEIIRAPYFIPESKKIHDLLNELQLKRLQIAIVLDEFGGTAGMVTLEDIVEELVGEIQDEYDEEKPIVEKISDLEFLVEGKATINDANEFLPIELPDDESYDSVAGLLNFMFGSIPEVGDFMNYWGYKFTVLKKSERMVELVRLERLPAALNEREES